MFVDRLALFNLTLQNLTKGWIVGLDDPGFSLVQDALDTSRCFTVSLRLYIVDFAQYGSVQWYFSPLAYNPAKDTVDS